MELFTQHLWAAVGLESKVLHIARSHFFPVAEGGPSVDDPSTSYEQDECLLRSQKKGRNGRQLSVGGQHRQTFNGRIGHAQDAVGDVYQAASGKRLRLQPAARMEAGCGDEWHEDSAAYVGPDICTDFLARTKRSQRSGRVGSRRRRTDWHPLLAPIDFALQLDAVECVDGGTLHPVGATDQPLPVQAAAACLHVTACMDDSLSLQYLPETLHQQQQQQQDAGSPKKVKWHDEREYRQQAASKKGASAPVSAAYSASSSQGGGFASELSSPERISHWSLDSSDDPT